MGECALVFGNILLGFRIVAKYLFMTVQDYDPVDT